MRRAFGAYLPYVALAATAIGFTSAPAEANRLAPLIFLASIVLFGLPHGAVDHLIMANLAGVPARSKRAVALVLVYLCLVLAVVAVWVVAPAVVWVGFIALTWFHWGQGDAWYLGQAGAPAPTAARGALPMLAPLVFHAEEYLAVSSAFIEAAGGTMENVPAVAALEVIALTVLLSLLVWEAKDAGGPRLESMVLLGYFALVPPVLAIAVYFCFWHAPRHLVRIAHEIRGSRWVDLLWVLRASVPLTLAAAAIAVVLFFALPTDDYFSVYLAVIAALTVPHVIVVSWQDARGVEGTRSY